MSGADPQAEREVCLKSLADLREVLAAMPPHVHATVERHAAAIRKYIATNGELTKVAVMMVGAEVTLESLE